MKDAIDKRNERERIAKSIVKRRNIVYITKEELERREQEEKHQQLQEDRKAAEELVKKLKDEENKKKAMEIQRLIAEREMLEHQLETGMDATGKNRMDEVTQERVEAILSEKSRQLRDIISAHAVEDGEEAKAVEPPISSDDGTNQSPAETGDGEADVPVPQAGLASDLPDMEVLFQETEEEEF